MASLMKIEPEKKSIFAEKDKKDLEHLLFEYKRV